MTIAENFVQAAMELISNSSALSKKDAAIAGAIVGGLYNDRPAAIPDNPVHVAEMEPVIRRGIRRFTHDSAKAEIIHGILSQAYTTAIDHGRFQKLMAQSRSV